MKRLDIANQLQRRVASIFLYFSIHLIGYIQAQTIIQVSPPIQKFYDGSSDLNYDTFNSQSFISQVMGASKYSISFWLKPTTSGYDGSNQAIVHLTMLNTYQPWFIDNQSSDYKQLSRMLFIEKSGSTLNYYVSDFTSTTSASTKILTSNITPGTWYYAYLGVDFTQQYYVALMYDATNALNNQVFSNTPSGTYSNEQLDQRVQLYIGGTVNRDHTTANMCFNGLIYNAKFIVNFQVPSSSAPYVLNDDSQKLYYFNYNVQCSQRIYSLFNQDIYSTFSSISSSCPSPIDPTNPYTVTNGITINASQYLTLTLNTEFQDMNFITFWINIKALPSAGQQGTLFQILNINGDTVIQVQLQSNGQVQVISFGATQSFATVQFTAGTWTKFYCNFAYHQILSGLFVSIMLNDQELVKNSQIGAFSIMRTTNQKIQIGGGQLQAQFMDIYGGQGSFLGTQQLFISKCIASVGIVNPQCIYCQAGYFLINGNCLLTCPDGYYRDTNARICRQCDITCLTCTGPQQNQCLTCGQNFPIYFQGFCLNQCPLGTQLSTDGSNQCLCHPSCDVCALNPVDRVTVTCQTCQDVGQFIIGYMCVIAQLCPYGTYASPANNQCTATCPSAPSVYIITDTVNRKCVASCDVGTILSKDGTQCLLSCPSHQYMSTISGPPTQTSFQCADCSGSCATCVNSATFCLSCPPGNLIHEYNGVCVGAGATNCMTGFYQDGIVCRVCQKGCTSCPTNFYLQGDTCVLKCPIDFSQNAGPPAVCTPLLTPVVLIANRTQIADPDHVPLLVGRQKDILIHADYYFQGLISEIYWYLTGTSQQYSEQFFFKTFNNVQDLVIPQNNLLPNTVYYLTVRVVATTGNYGEQSIMVQTSAEIVDGEFTITPSYGISGITQFSVFYSLWNHPTDSLLYDLTYSIETGITMRNQTSLFKNDLHQVFIGSNKDGTINFVFPPFQNDKVVNIELMVYSANERKKQTLKVSLSKFNGDTLSMESNVRRFTPSSSVTIDQYLNITYQMAYLYGTIQVKQANKLFQQEILRQNQLYQLKNSFCADNVSCNGYGQCQTNFYDPQMFQCSCLEEYAGDFCSWDDQKILKIINLLTYNIQVDLLNRVVTQQQLFSITQILKNIVAVSDGLSKKTFRFIMTFLNQIQGIVIPRQEIFQNIFQIIQEILNQAVTRPSLRPDERIKYTVLLRQIMNSYIQKFSQQNIQLNVDYIFTFEHANIYLTNQRGRELQNNYINYGKFYTIPMERVIVQIPFSTFQYTDTVTVQLIEWNIDLVYPRPNSTTNHIEINLLANNQPLTINGLQNNKITYHFQKKAGFPPLRPDFNSQYFCVHLANIDFTTSQWTYDQNCVYTFENEFYIRCQCNQLDLATVLRGTIEYYQDYLPHSDTLVFYSSKYMNKKMQYYSTNYINYDTSIPFAFRNYSSPTYPTSYVPFKWDSPAFILFVIFIVCFLVLSIIHQLLIRLKPSSEYDVKSKDILLLTYHPFISLAMFGHTAKSHTYQMRLAKFFSLLVGMLAMNCVAFDQIAISIPLIKIDARIMGSAFASILLNASMNYCVEGLYFIIKRHIYKEKRQQLVYNILFFLNMIGNAAFGTWCNGYTDKEDYGNFMAAFIISLIVDYFVFDIFVLSYAFYEIESNYLKFFAFRGFYITPAENLESDQYDIIGYKKQKYIDVNDQELEKLKQSNIKDEDLQKLEPAEAIDKVQGFDQISRPLSSHSKKSQTSNKIFPSKTNVP
ncbi:hypothetical protein ABPG74_012432 [Tetrahymena malaccensis]